MKLKFKPIGRIILFVILLSSVQFSNLLAQNNTKVNEPPVPIYVISPYHEDSLATGEGSAQALSSSMDNNLKKLDTLQQQFGRLTVDVSDYIGRGAGSP